MFDAVSGGILSMLGLLNITVMPVIAVVLTVYIAFFKKFCNCNEGKCCKNEM